MPETKIKYANFPEPGFKVVIGPNINAVTTKALGRLSIGTYEMSFVQQERGATTGEAARIALTHIVRPLDMKVASESHRDYVCCLSAANAEHRFQVWVTTPFELTQSAHIVWCKYCDLGPEGKISVAFKLSTSFTSDEIETLIRNTQKNAIKLPEGEPFLLKGNPPPRFAKKAVPAAGDASAPVVAAAPPAGDAAAPATP
jgi:hypothetical protein